MANFLFVLSRDNNESATCYREQNNLPFIIAHPDYQGGKRCKAVTSHVDISTTLLSIAKGESPPVEGLPGAGLFAVSTMDGTSFPQPALRKKWVIP